jgi:hypothetical protein
MIEQLKQAVQWQTRTGMSFQIDNMTVTPQSQALTISTPYGGFVWQRPTAVLVERNGYTEHIPIADPTRMALLVFTGFTIAITIVSIFTRLIPRRRKPR